MPDLDSNREMWDGSYDWSSAGDEWSDAWGGTYTQWHAVVRPRLVPFLPARRVLEIAPGFGRWSQFLLEQAEDYVGIDLAEAAVEGCRARFASVPHAAFRANGDGRSLPGVADRSIDLAFSFDSLVHVEADVIAGYLGELSRVLADDGVVFIHHSNLGGAKPVGPAARTLMQAGQSLRGRSTVGLDHWRAPSMSAERFVELAADAGLRCVGQEIIPWVGSRPIDCISVATRPGSRWDRENVVISNPHFAAEAASAAALAGVWSTFAEPGAGPTAEQVGNVRWYGTSSTMIASRQVGPWAVSMLGPWPRWEQVTGRLRRRR